MSVELPDWLRGTLLLGRDGAGNIIPILIDAAGQINVLLRGVDALGTVRTVMVDNLGELYAVLRGAGGVDVTLDASGNLVCVLKGEFGGALTTIAVDLNGRIEAFLMDSEDQWGNTIRVGNAEHAARMGSPSVYDWRGQTLFQQTFEQGMGNLVPTLAGVGAAVTVDPVYSLMGGYSLKMLGGSDLGMSALVQGIIGANPSPRVGLSVCWSAIGAYDYVTFGLLYSIAGTRYIARIIYEPTTGRLGYWNDTGAWTWFVATSISEGPSIFNWAKVSMDFTTGQYLRAMLNNEEHAIHVPMATDGLGYDDAIEVEIQVFSTAGNNHGIYLDRYIVTVNEP